MFQLVPPQGQGQFWPLGHDMNKLGNGPQGDAAYQISKFYPFQVQKKRILNFTFIASMF